MDNRSAGQMLLCRIGGQLCVLPIEHVRETLRPLPIESLADSPPFVSGVSIVRGKPVPVVDAARLLGSVAGSPSRWITLALQGRDVVLAVDQVVGVIEAPSAQPVDLVAPLLSAVAADTLTAIGVLDAQLLLVLDTARLVPEKVWLAMENPGAQP